MTAVNLTHYFSLLFFAVLAAPSFAGRLSPTPVVVIDNIALPKVSIRIVNPDETEVCIIWAAGMSWEEQNKWFSLRPGGGGKEIELRPKPQAYRRNFAQPQRIPARKSLTFHYDFSDGKRWVLPNDFSPGQWDFDIKAHLEIPVDLDAHTQGVFVGHVTSGWYQGNGREVEAAGKPERNEKHDAIERRLDFPWERLTADLEKWNTGTLPGKKSVGDFFGGDFPWGTSECLFINDRSLAVILPDRGVLQFRFHVELPNSYKLVDARKEGFAKERTVKAYIRYSVPVKETLQGTPARLLKSITLTKASEQEKGPEWKFLFKRAFDWKGRVDQKATDGLWFP